MKPGRPERIVIDPRYPQLVAQHAIRDVYDAFVELITNADGSYYRLSKATRIHKDGGPILIEVEARRGKRPSKVIVRDRAEGMDLAEMRSKIQRMGARTSVEGDRGFMGRGLKDCAILGRVIVESIKEDVYYKCEVNSGFEFIAYEPPERATPDRRKTLGIPRGNGTVVTAEIQEDYRLPRFENLSSNLPWHYALRDIFAADGPNHVVLRNLNESDNGGERVVFHPPDGTLVAQHEYEVVGYPTKATLSVFRSSVPLEDPSDRFRRSGFIVKGERAIHECSYFNSELERDPLAKRYFGRLECAFIDRLCFEYDNRRAAGQVHPPENPALVIDPNRQTGLRREHPFTRALLRFPVDRLRELVAKDREEERTKRAQVASEETQSRLDQLAKVAGQFLKQQLEDIEELTTGEQVDELAFAKLGMLIYPTYARVAVGQERRLTVYARATLLGGRDPLIRISSDHPAVAVLDSEVRLNQHRRRPDLLIGGFRIRGQSLEKAVLVRATLDGLGPVDALIQVVEYAVEDRLFRAPLEFERAKYEIREGKRKALLLFAKCPELVAEEVAIDVSSTDPSGIPVRGRCRLAPVEGTNFARGEVVVQGRRLGAKARIEARISDAVAATSARVVQREEEEGVRIDIQLRDEDYHNFRAKWADHEGKPNLLLVSARHKSVRRYLGPPPDFEGQNTPHFRVLLAEIVAESVCRKALRLEAQERPWEFRWADLKDDYLIADDVVSRLQQRLRDFVAAAHIVMLGDDDLRTLKSEG